MPDPANARPESDRLAFIAQRDGLPAARDWAERTLDIYRTALNTQGSHAADGAYRPLFMKSVAEFEEWLKENSR
jgi:hypothetical protein